MGEENKKEIEHQDYFPTINGYTVSDAEAEAFSTYNDPDLERRRSLYEMSDYPKERDKLRQELLKNFQNDNYNNLLLWGKDYFKNGKGILGLKDRIYYNKFAKFLKNKFESGDSDWYGSVQEFLDTAYQDTKFSKRGLRFRDYINSNINGNLLNYYDKKRLPMYKKFVQDEANLYDSYIADYAQSTGKSIMLGAVNSIALANKFLSNYYDSDAYYHRLYGTYPHTFRSINNVSYLPISSYDSQVKGNDMELGVWDPQYEYVNTDPDLVAVHEFGHLVDTYNTRRADLKKTEDSPYYGNDYSNIPDYIKQQLVPINSDSMDTHDKELSENYSDLLTLRAALYKYGLYDSSSPESIFWSQELYDDLYDNYIMNHPHIKNLRFIQNHTKEQVINSLRYIAQTLNNLSNSQYGYAKHGGALNYLNYIK